MSTYVLLLAQKGVRGVRNRAAFSLLEVLVAMALLGLGLAVVVEAFGGGVRATQRIALREAATLLAESKLAEARLSLEPNQGELAEGQFRWRVTLSDVPSRVPYGDDTILRQVEVRVTWGDGGDAQIVVLTSLLVDPLWQ